MVLRATHEQVMTRCNVFLAPFVGVMCVAVSCLAQSASETHAESQKDSLKNFLQSYVGPATEGAKTTRYSSALVDLGDDRTLQVIVYLTSGGWCGSGGCTMLVLDPKGSSYKVVARIPTVRLPIWVLTTKSNGWHDIRVSRRVPVLTFDGKAYRSSPSASSRLNGKVQGKIVISETAEDLALYP